MIDRIIGSKSTTCGPANTINVIIGILSRTISLIDSDLWTTSLSELWHISMLGIIYVSYYQLMYYSIVELKKCSAVDVLQSLNDYHPFDNFMTTIAKGIYYTYATPLSMPHPLVYR